MLVYYRVVWGCFFEFLKIVWEFYVMFVNVDMRETVLLITNESTDYFSAAIFIELLKFWCEYLLLFLMHARVLATNCGKEVGREGGGGAGQVQSHTFFVL